MSKDDEIQRKMNAWQWLKKQQKTEYGLAMMTMIKELPSFTSVGFILTQSCFYCHLLAASKGPNNVAASQTRAVWWVLDTLEGPGVTWGRWSGRSTRCETPCLWSLRTRGTLGRWWWGCRCLLYLLGDRQQVNTTVAVKSLILAACRRVQWGALKIKLERGMKAARMKNQSEHRSLVVY